MLVWYSLGLVSYLTVYLTEQDFKAVRNELWGIRRKWHDIGIELDLPKPELDNFREQHNNDFKECLKEMITKWLKRTNPRPTWEALIEVLKGPVIEEEALAENLATKYLG